MTAKRYHKLFRSEMTRLMMGKPGAAQCIKVAATASPFRKDGTGTVKSYEEMWTALRSAFTYPGNVPPVK